MMYDEQLRKIESCALDSFENLVSHNSAITLVIQKEEDRLAAYLGLPPAEETTALAAANIKAAARAPLPIRPGFCIERVKERSGNRLLSASQPTALNGTPVRRATNHIKPMVCDFTLDRCIRVMHPSDYIKITLKPAEAVKASKRYDEETNSCFLKERCYWYEMSASSREVANGLAEDFARSQATFRLVDSHSSESDEPTSKINTHLLIYSESLLLARAVDSLLVTCFKPDIEALMTPGATQAFKPDIGVGFNNNNPVGFALKHFLQNIAVLGAVGSGKTELLASMVRQLRDAGIPSLIIAPVKHDFSEKFPNADIYRDGSDKFPLRFNLLDLPPDNQNSARLAATALVNMIDMGGDGSALPFILESCLQGLYASDKEISLSGLASIVKGELQGYKGDVSQNLTQAAVGRLSTLYGTSEFGCEVGNIELDEIFRQGKITVIELQEMEPLARKAFAALFLERLRSKYLSLSNIGRERPRLVVVIDELHELLKERGTPVQDAFRNVLNNSLNTAGGQAVGFVLADQRLDLVGEIAEDGCSSHILMRGLATEQAANVLRLPPDSPMLKHIHRLRPGEGLLHVTGEDTIALSAAPLADKPDVPSTTRLTKKYCPFKSCGEACTTCDGTIHRIAKSAVRSQLLNSSAAYIAYRDKIVSMKENASAAYKHAMANHDRNPKTVPVPPKPVLGEIYESARADLLKACIEVATHKEFAEGGDLAQIGPVLQFCVDGELRRQLCFKKDI